MFASRDRSTGAGSQTRPIRIMIADDHPVLREGVAAVIRSQTDLELVGEAVDGNSAVATFRQLLPDITLMDLRMPGCDGVEATAAIRQEFPTARIIVLTTFSGDALATRALRAGAGAYLLKASPSDELLGAIRAVHSGRQLVPPDIAHDIAEHAIDDPLTLRELDVLQLVGEGNGNKDIAILLGVSDHTVKARLKSIFLKLDVVDRAQAVVRAARRGIIDI
jgi:DNA-binding NarL/FixJ family response regulator